jgi:hypothetical protein
VAGRALLIFNSVAPAKRTDSMPTSQGQDDLDLILKLVPAWALVLIAFLVGAQVRKTPCRLRSRANLSLLSLCSHMNAWANLHLVGPT